MIRMFYGDDISVDLNIFDSMYRLRAKVFNERLNWQVDVKDGLEKDRFDNFNPLYFVYLNDKNQVIATFRLLQTTGPTMIRDIFPRCLPDNMDIRSPIIWESTRFAVDADLAKEYGKNGLSKVTGEMLSALIEIGTYAGLSHIITVLDVRMERILRRAGCPIERLGDPVDYGGTQTLAILMECNDEWVSNIRNINQLGASSLFDEYQRLQRA